MRKARFKDDDGADHGSSEEGVTVAVNPLAAPRDDGAAVGETHHAARTDTETNGVASTAAHRGGDPEGVSGSCTGCHHTPMGHSVEGCEGEEELKGFDRDGDGRADAIALDTDGDGVVDSIGYDTTGDGVVDAIALDTDGDGVLDSIGYDTTGDGVVDIVQTRVEKSEVVGLKRRIWLSIAVLTALSFAIVVYVVFKWYSSAEDVVQDAYGAAACM